MEMEVLALLFFRYFARHDVEHKRRCGMQRLFLLRNFNFTTYLILLLGAEGQI